MAISLEDIRNGKAKIKPTQEFTPIKPTININANSKVNKKPKETINTKLKTLETQVNNMRNNVKKKNYNISNAISDIANIGDAVLNLNPIANTRINVATNMAEGTLKTGENILDALNDASSFVNSNVEYGVNRLLGKSKKEAQNIKRQEQEKNRNFVSKNLTQEFKEKFGYTPEVQKKMEENSLVTSDNLGGKIVQGIGGMVPSLLVGQYLGMPGVENVSTQGLNGVAKAKAIASNIGRQAVANIGANSVLAGSSYGGGLEQAYQSGANEKQARLYGLGSSAKEIATEWITGGIPGLSGKGGLDLPVEKLIDKGTGRIKNEVTRSLVNSILKAGYGVIGEGAEEALAEILDPIIKNATYSKGEKIDWNAVVESAIVGGITGGILNAPQTMYNTRTGLENARIEQSQRLDNLINNQSNDIKNQPFIEFGNKVGQDLSRNSNEYNPNFTQNSNINNKNNINNKSNIPLVDVAERIKNLTSRKGQLVEVSETGTPIYETANGTKTFYLDDIGALDWDNNINKTFGNIDNDLNVDTENSRNSQIVQNEAANNNQNVKEQTNNRFVQDIDNNYSLEKKNVYNQVMKKGLLDNSQASHDLVDLIANASEYTKTNYNLVNNQELTSQYNNLRGQGVDTNSMMINGFQNQDGVTINIDSNKALNTVVGHETTHLFQNTKAYQNLQETVFELAKQRREYNQRRSQLESIYQGSNANIDQELTADLVGDYIFTDQEFIDNLHNKHYGIFTKIYDFIKHLYNLATAGSSEKRLLENAKYMFDKANGQALEQARAKTINETLYSVSNNEQSIENNANIMYNMRGIQLEKSEYAQVMKDIHNKQAQNLNHTGDNYVYSGQYFYTFSENGFDNVVIDSKIKIENNEALISKLEEEYRNGDNIPRNTNQIISEFKSNERVYPTNIVGSETRNSTEGNVGLVDRNIREQTRNNGTTNIRQIETNNQQNELNNSSFSLSRNQNLKEQQAINYFGTTQNLNEAGYLTTNGQYLDFSGRKDGARGGNRTVDHREISNIYSSSERSNIEKNTSSNETVESNIMYDFMEQGNIRLKGSGFELAVEPSETQYSSLYDYINYYDGEVYIDFDNNSNSYDTVEYNKGTSASKIINDIKNYYKTGELPTNNVSNYQYSLSHNSQDNNVQQNTQNIPLASVENQNPQIVQSVPIVDAFNQNNQQSQLTPNTTYKEVVNSIPNVNESKFKRNVTENSQFLTEENRTKLSNEDMWNYDKISNDESMKRARTELETGGDQAISEWFANNKELTSTDTAKGWLLLEKYQRQNNYDMVVEVAKKMRDMGTKTGQAMQMYNLMARLTPEGMVKYAVSELSDAFEIYSKGQSREWINENHQKFDLTPDETKFIIDTAKKAQTLKGYEQKVEYAKIRKLLSDKLPPARGAGIKAWMRTSMLLNPKTQIRNIMGNAIIAPVNALADTFSAIADRQIAKKTGKRTTGMLNVKQFGKGFKEGLYQSYNDFKKGISTRDINGNRFEIGQGKSFNDNTSLGNKLNKVDNFLGFVLDAGDRPFYEAAYLNSINNQMVLNDSTKITADMMDIATNEALQRTWQDNNSYTKLVLDIRRGMNKVNIKGYGLGDVIIPFAKTPANLTKAIVDYSPVGLAKTLLVDSKKFNRSLTNGQYDVKAQHQFVQNLGKATAGSLLYALGYALAKANITTGKSDDDKDVANFMQKTLGIQSYSIKIGNKSFTYDWAQPVAAPLAIMADLVNSKNESDNLLEKITSALDVPFNLILEQSFMSGLQDILSNYEGIPAGLLQQILDLPSRATPTLFKQIADMFDSTQRTTFEKNEPIETAKNKVISKIPGLSSTLPETRDTLGREVKKYGGNNNIFNVFFNPANVNKGQKSKSAEEIYNVYQSTGDKTIMPRTAPYDLQQTIDKKQYGKDLNAKERAEFSKISGGIIEKNVQKLNSDSRYKKLTDEEKAEVIKGIVDYSYNKAKSKLLDVEISRNYKKADDYAKRGGFALCDYYITKTYDNRD